VVDVHQKNWGFWFSGSPFTVFPSFDSVGNHEISPFLLRRRGLKTFARYMSSLLPAPSSSHDPDSEDTQVLPSEIDGNLSVIDGDEGALDPSSTNPSSSLTRDLSVSSTVSEFALTTEEIAALSSTATSRVISIDHRADNSSKSVGSSSSSAGVPSSFSASATTPSSKSAISTQWGEHRKAAAQFPSSSDPIAAQQRRHNNHQSPIPESPSPGTKRAKTANSPGLLSRITSLESQNLETHRVLKNVFTRIEAVETLRNAERQQAIDLIKQNRLLKALALQLQNRVERTEELLR
jgi:hypothetical protein